MTQNHGQTSSSPQHYVRFRVHVTHLYILNFYIRPCTKQISRCIWWHPHNHNSGHRFSCSDEKVLFKERYSCNIDTVYTFKSWHIHAYMHDMPTTEIPGSFSSIDCICTRSGASMSRFILKYNINIGHISMYPRQLVLIQRIITLKCPAVSINKLTLSLVRISKQLRYTTINNFQLSPLHWLIHRQESTRSIT